MKISLIFALALHVLTSNAAPNIGGGSYSTMNQNSFSPPPSAYSAPAPAPRYSPPAPAYRPPQRSYSAPAPAPAPAPRYNAPAPSYSPPQQSYGAPAPQPAPRYGAPAPSPSYGAPQQEYSAPANYEFNYHVQDQGQGGDYGPYPGGASASGNDYGHSERRQGDNTQGQYFVRMADGRRQVVDYVADQGGYRPNVRYE